MTRHPEIDAIFGDGELGPTGVDRWWSRRVDEDVHGRATALGLARVRHLHQMCRPLPLAGELARDLAPIVTRDFEPGIDDEEWVALNAEAFSHHPEQGGWQLEDLHRLMWESWFDPADFLVVERDGAMVGFNWMKFHATAEPTIGEIFVIGVHPSAAGHGLGRSLAIAGLDRIWQRHQPPVGMLYVEADNLPALRLYESLGFTVDHSEAAYELGSPA